jgi:rod shape-determining protein MreD
MRFIALFLVQVLILNNIQFSGYINPYLYVLFILMLPFQVPRWLLLLSSFFMGLGIDFFTHTPGLHAFASTFMAFMRPGLIRALTSNREIEPGSNPDIRVFGFAWFLAYASVLVFLHHLVLFYMEVFRFNGFFITLTRVFASTFATMALILLTQFIFLGHRK